VSIVHAALHAHSQVDPANAALCARLCSVLLLAINNVCIAYCYIVDIAKTAFQRNASLMSNAKAITDPHDIYHTTKAQTDKLTQQPRLWVSAFPNGMPAD
jgi:hypothetical protein